MRSFLGLGDSSNLKKERVIIFALAYWTLDLWPCTFPTHDMGSKLLSQVPLTRDVGSKHRCP